MKKVILFLLFICLGAGAFFGVNYLNKKAVIREFEKEGFGVTGELSAMSGLTTSHIYLGDSVAESEGDTLKFRSMDGKNTWSRKLKGEIRSISASGESVAAFDSTGFIICLDREGKTLWSEQLTELPEAWIPDNKGGMLVEYFRMGSGRLDYFHSDGKKSNTIEIEGAKVTAFASDTNREFAVFVIDTSGDRFQGRLMSFTADGKMSWAKNMGEQLIYKLEFLNGELIGVIEDGILKITRKNGELVADQPGGKVEAFSFHEKVGALMMKNGGYRFLYVLDRENNLKKSVQLAEDARKIEVSAAAIISYDSEYMTIYDNKGIKKFDYNFSAPLNRIYFGSTGSIFADLGTKLQRLEGGKKK